MPADELWLPLRKRSITPTDGGMGLQTYAMVRLDRPASAAELETAAGRPVAADNELADGLSWICSCVLEQSGTPVGVVSIFQARDLETLRESAGTDRPVNSIIPMAAEVAARALENATYSDASVAPDELRALGSQAEPAFEPLPDQIKEGRCPT